MKELITLLIPTIIIGIVAVNVLFQVHERVWTKLQEKYLYPEKKFRGVIVRSYFVAVNGRPVLTPVKIKVSRVGLFIKPYAPQSVFSKPVLIPWADVKGVANHKRRKKRLVISGVSELTVDVASADFYKIVKYVNRIEKSQ